MPVEIHELLKLSSSRHDHLCPRQVLGVRMGLAGLEAIGLEAPMPHKAALVFIETDGCFPAGRDQCQPNTFSNRGGSCRRGINLAAPSVTHC